VPGQPSALPVRDKSSVDTPAGVPTPQARPTQPVAPTNAPVVRSTPVSNPPRMDELTALYRASGPKVLEDRRRILHRLIAAAGVAQETGEDPKDAEFYNELLRLARRFGLFN